MKKILKIPTIFLIAIILTSICILPTYATTYRERTLSGSSYFDDDYEAFIMYVQNGSLEIGTLQFGFSNLFIDEDYCYARGLLCNCQAAIQRVGYDSSIKWGPLSEGARDYSIYDLNHKTDTVKYGIKWGNTYSGTITWYNI